MLNKEIQQGGNMAVRQTKCSGNSFWSNRLYHGSNESNESNDLVVTTDSLDMGFAANADAVGTIVAGGSGVTSYGFVWSTSESPTLDDTVVEVGDSSFTGEFETTIHGLDYPGTVYVRAYATNSSGTVYGGNQSGEVQICLAAGTVIKTLFGDKNIEDITYDDELVVWNFDKGCFDVAKPIWMVKPFASSWRSVVTFENGSQLTTIRDGKGHRIFNANRGKFTHLMSDDTPVGTTTFTENGRLVRVKNKEIIRQKTVFYNIITNKHFNVFANGILTSTGLNNLYPIKNMKFQKTNRKLQKNNFYVPDELFSGLRLAEQPENYPDLKAKIERMKFRQLPKEIVYC